MEDNTEQSPNYKGVVLTAWIMLGLTCLIALIPAIGFLTWFVATPILLITFILGIVAIAKGGTLQGVLVLLASLIAVPVFLFVAPVVTTVLFAASVDTIEKVAHERQGEHQTERGLIYYFSDGVIALDTTVTPNRFHIYAKHSKGRKIEKVELIEDGIEVSGRGGGEGVRGLLVGEELAVGYSGADVPGKVHVIMEKIDKDGELFTDGRHMAIDPDSIQQLIDRGDWNASVRELWEK